VRLKRIELKIPFFNPHYEVWTEEQLKLLGQIPDEEVARQTGHSLTSVRGPVTNGTSGAAAQ